MRAEGFWDQGLDWFVLGEENVFSETWEGVKQENVANVLNPKQLSIRRWARDALKQYHSASEGRPGNGKSQFQE